jgi:hypothetical protein
LPDLYAVVGDNLYIYQPSFPPGAYGDPQLVSRGLTGHTIVGTRLGANPAFLVRNDRTGALDLWVGDAANGIPAGGTGGARYTYRTSGYSASALPSISGADINVDGSPDLWGVNRVGNVNAYLTKGSASIKLAVRNTVRFWGS